MREIKFRFVEDYDQPKYAKIFPLDVYGITECMKLNKDDQFGHTVEEYYRDIIGGNYSNIKLQQYTGLKDKNGKEIYEGDIVSCDQVQGLGKVIGVVNFGVEIREWSGDKGWLPDARVYLDTRKFQEHNGSEFCTFHLNPEILGNIYENLNLLSSKEK